MNRKPNEVSSPQLILIINTLFVGVKSFVIARTTFRVGMSH